MTGIASLAQVIYGLQRVRSAIIERVRARKIPISEADFTWNHGNLSLVALRDPIRMVVRAGSRYASAEWPQLWLEGCWDRIDRPEVRQEIDRIVNVLAPQS